MKQLDNYKFPSKFWYFKWLAMEQEVEGKRDWIFPEELEDDKHI